MKSKEEILLPYHQTKDIDGNITTGEAVWIEHALIAMEEYASQKWINPSDNLPTIGDYSVLAHFENGSIETVHVADMFGLIGDGLDENGVQKYTRWYMHNNPKVTHWMLLPNSPNVSAEPETRTTTA